MKRVWTKSTNTEFLFLKEDGNDSILLHPVGREIRIKSDELTEEPITTKFVRASTLQNEFVWAKISHKSNEYAYGFLTKGLNFISKYPRQLSKDELVSRSPVHSIGIVDDYIWSFERGRLMIVQLHPNPWEHSVIAYSSSIEHVSLDALRLLHPTLSHNVAGIVICNRKR